MFVDPCRYSSYTEECIKIMGKREQIEQFRLKDLTYKLT